MMYKDEKGITIVTLTIAIIIMIILSSVTIYSGNNIIKQAKLQTINTNMMLIQAKVKTMAEQANFNGDTNGYKGSLIDDNTKAELMTGGIIDSEGIYYLLSQEDLIEMGLEKIDIEDGYIVNYDEEEIIYVKGFKLDGITYYKLSEMKRLTIK